MSKKHKHMKYQMSVVGDVEKDLRKIEIRKLKRQAAVLRRLPRDFRDISPGSPDWELFADITNRRKEMDGWASGPALCLAPLNSMEECYFGKDKIVHYPEKVRWDAKHWKLLLAYAEAKHLSWIYLPDEDPLFIAAFNQVLSHFNYNVRVKAQILSESTGKPVGVVY